MARRSDGSVVAWGNNACGQCNVPALPAGLTYVEVAAGDGHTVARRSDGSVVAWGNNGYGQCNVPALPAGLTYVEVAAGDDHTVARRSDGSVVAWGDNYYGQCNVPALPAGSPTSRSRRAPSTRSRGGATAPSSRGETTSTASATCRRFRRAHLRRGRRGRPSHGGALRVAAAVVSVGTGCGGAGMPVFGCNAPRIGQDLAFSLTCQGTPNASGFLDLLRRHSRRPIGLGPGAPSRWILPTASPSSGDADTPGDVAYRFGVPLGPPLVGLQVALQIALFGTAGPSAST